MLLDELPIFEHIKNDILMSSQHAEPNLPVLASALIVNRQSNNNNNGNNLQKKKPKKVEFITPKTYSQPPLSAYSAIDTRPFLSKRPLNEGGVLLERKRLQLYATRKLGLKLFKPIGYRYRHVKTGESSRKNRKKTDSLPNDINDISRGSDMFVNPTRDHNLIQRPDQFQFHESSGLMINMNGTETQSQAQHDSLIVPRNLLSGGSNLLSDMNESNEYDDINTMETINMDRMGRRVSGMRQSSGMRQTSYQTQRDVVNSEIEPIAPTTIDNHSYFESSISRVPGNFVPGEVDEESDKSMDEYLDEVEDEDW